MSAFRYVWLCAFAAMTGVISVPVAARAMELVMFESPTCGTCKLFKREVLPIYASSPAGKVFPLWVAGMRDKVPFRLNEPVTFTPTFVWVDGGVEVGRFAGYYGKERFFRIVNSAAKSYRGRHVGQEHTYAGQEQGSGQW